MTHTLPRWIQRRYAVLYQEYHQDTFTFEDAKETIDVKSGSNVLSVFLCDLFRYGWLEIELDKRDRRKRVYQLKSPNQAFEEILNTDKSYKDIKVKLRELKQLEKQTKDKESEIKHIKKERDRIRRERYVKIDEGK